MVYRNIKREDFDEALQSLGNDPAILEHETQAGHLQSKQQAPRQTQIKQIWSGLDALKESGLKSLNLGTLLITLGLLALLIGMVFLSFQVQSLLEHNQQAQNQAWLKRELEEIQMQISGLHDLSEEEHNLLLEVLEEIQKRRQITVTHQNQRLVNPDPDEIDLKKWRHLGVGKNKDGAYVMLHDGQQTRLFVKNALAKPTWQITHFDNNQTTLQGPAGKQVVLTSP